MLLLSRQEERVEESQDHKITQVVRIDLDGDGVEEVLVTADTYDQQLTRNLQKKGSYSLVLLRKVIHGKVDTLVIEEYYFPSTRKYGVPHRLHRPGRQAGLAISREGMNSKGLLS